MCAGSESIYIIIDAKNDMFLSTVDFRLTAANCKTRCDEFLIAKPNYLLISPMCGASCAAIGSPIADENDGNEKQDADLRFVMNRTKCDAKRVSKRREKLCGQNIQEDGKPRMGIQARRNQFIHNYPVHLRQSPPLYFRNNFSILLHIFPLRIRFSR